MKLNTKTKLRSISKNITTLLLPLALLIATGITMTGCHSSKYYMTRPVTVNTTPGASIFWQDGDKILTVDTSGQAKIYMSEQQYRKGHKRIVVAKAGYVPQTVSLRKKFNIRSIYNILFPPAFLWAHYTTIDFKKENNIPAGPLSSHDAEAYMKMADEASSPKKKARLLKNAVYQDPDNAHGMAALSLNKLSELYFETKDYKQSALCAARACDIAPGDMSGMKNMQRANAAITAKAEKRMRRAAMWANIANVTSTALTAAATFMPGGTTGSSDYQTTANYGNTPSKGNKSNKEVKIAGRKVPESLNINNSRRTYYKYTDLLIRMKTYHETEYNANERINIQKKMRQIRENLAKKGEKMPKSEWEDWDGKK